MIKPSEIAVNFKYVDDQGHFPYWRAKADLNITSVLTLDTYTASNFDRRRLAEEIVLKNLYEHIYGDLRAPMAELASIAMRNTSFGADAIRASQLINELQMKLTTNFNEHKQ